MYKVMTMLAVLATCTAPVGAMANAVDGKLRMVCAATTAFVCAPGGNCVTGAPDAVNLPTFWHVDPATKAVRSKRPDGSERMSAIDTMAEESGRLVLQGSDEGFGWSVSIDVASGKMLLSAGSELGYLVFGECTTP